MSLKHLIQSFQKDSDTSLSLFIPIRINIPSITLIERFMKHFSYVDSLSDENFESFMITNRLARLIFENIHCLEIGTFNLEMRIISKQANARIIEVPINEICYTDQISFPKKLKNLASMIILLVATICDIYEYSYRTPIHEPATLNNESDELVPFAK